MPHKVMLVDDAAMMRLVISNFIAPLPEFEIVASAANGKVALEQLKKHPDLELILLDIEMPEMDGLEFLRQPSSGRAPRSSFFPRWRSRVRRTPPRLASSVPMPSSPSHPARYPWTWPTSAAASSCKP